MDARTSAADAIRLAPAAGSRVVVVGGCGGIGRAVVAALSAADTQVAVLDLPASLDQHPVPEGVVGIEIDARDDDAVARAFAAVKAGWDGVDCLINLAGHPAAPLSVDAMSPAVWDDTIAGNLRSAFLIAHHGLPLLKAAGKGTLVMVSSGLGIYGGVNFGPYAAAKGAMNALVKTIARENAPAIRANAVAPSLVQTAFTAGGTGRPPRDSAAPTDLTGYLRAIPLGRIAQPADIVGPILFLAGPASEYMTGQILHVNGGSFTP